MAMSKISLSRVFSVIFYNILVISIFIFFFNSLNKPTTSYDDQPIIGVMYSLSNTSYEDIISTFVDDVFYTRNKAMLNGSVEDLYSFYNTNNINGRYSLEYEFKRISYLLDWSIYRRIIFTNIKSTVQINDIQRKDGKSIIKLEEHCTFNYIYNNDKSQNSFHLTIPHILTLAENNQTLSIDKDYYADFLNDGLNDYSYKLTENKITYTKKLNLNFNIDHKLKIDDILRYEKFPFTNHTATVINFDSNGYPLITSSTFNIENMPYDLGWNTKNIKEHKK